ncbi:hypothetical protein UNDKW_1096 [Undibacterium sp. KW1]|nr:hypothetical protein UNDKW_1096 [Undibacterium sp. KW1]
MPRVTAGCDYFFYIVTDDGTTDYPGSRGRSITQPATHLITQDTTNDTADYSTSTRPFFLVADLYYLN